MEDELEEAIMMCCERTRDAMLPTKQLVMHRLATYLEALGPISSVLRAAAGRRRPASQLEARPAGGRRRWKRVGAESGEGTERPRI